MVRSRPDPVPVAQTLVEALPALIEQAVATGGPLALAVYAMRTALSEAEHAIRKAKGSAEPATLKEPSTLRN